MRHWSLYEAMLHSPYVAVRLQTWHDKGRRLLQEMLVKMGFPAPQFRQKWGKQPISPLWAVTFDLSWP